MRTRKYCCFFIMSFFFLTANAVTLERVNDGKYITVSGVVKDKSNKKTLPYATISLVGNSTATMSNADGEFMLKVKEPIGNSRIEVSYVGYENAYIHLDSKPQTVWLTPSDNMLDEILVRGREPRSLVEEAVRKIPSNYSLEPCALTGFYRESVRKRKRYINIAEAVINLDKSSYVDGVANDKVRVLKGRRLVSPKLSDTLAVKLQGGPTSAIYLDIVKNPDLLLRGEILSFYDFHMEEATVINDRPQYVVRFSPNRELPYALYYGKLYIDKERLSFTCAEFNLDLSDRNKAIRAILHKKPVGLRFKPVEVSYRVNYSDHEGKSYLSYLRYDILFKCDWRRKLFSTSYNVLSEMVVTDIQEAAPQIAPEEVFDKKDVLSDNVALFFDEDFWGSYNIIKPDESLEDAVDKLKKQYD